MPGRQKCWCGDCKRCRGRASARAKTRALAYGTYDNGRRDPAAAIAHIESLRATGMGKLAIAEAAGVSGVVVTRIHRRTWISAATEAKILAVTAPTTKGTVSAWRVTRRLQALAAIGWSGHEIARRLGKTQANVSLLTAGTPKRCIMATYNAVDALYQELHMTIGPSWRARDTARAKGWLPPLAWDDIDNPDERPEDAASANDEADPATIRRILDGDWRLPATTAERTEVIRRWQAAGISNGEIARRTGWNIWRDQKAS